MFLTNEEFMKICQSVDPIDGDTQKLIRFVLSLQEESDRVKAFVIAQAHEIARLNLQLITANVENENIKAFFKHCET